MKQNKLKLIFTSIVVIILIGMINIFVYANDIYQTVDLGSVSTFVTAMPLKDGESCCYEFAPEDEGVYFIKSSGYNDDTCNSITIKSEHHHNYRPSTTTESSCIEDTEITYICSCGLSYIENIPATGHAYVETINKATFSQNGKKLYKCKICGASYSKVISKISSVKLSTSKVTYNGKKRTPSVIVTDTNGDKLVKDIDYTVTYDSGRKLPGIYTITVIFKGNYTGSKSLNFTIVPKETTGVKATEKTGTSITLAWSKTTGATGYRVYQYSSIEGKYVAKKTTTSLSYKVTGLKKETSYKFKVKPYTKMEDGTVIWGSSSESFSAKTTKGYGVDISGTSATLYVGETKQLKATTTPSGKTVTWNSSDKSIAKVSSDGKVTAMKKGIVTITAYVKVGETTYKDICKVTVKIPSVTVNQTSASIVKGKTLKLKATTVPSDLDVTWKSSNTSVATVSSTGTVTAKKAGSATITASITYKGVTYKKTCKITVLSATAKENFSKLMNYVNKNGKYDNYGCKYIKKTVLDNDYTYVYTISCNLVDGISFTLNTDCPYGEGIESEIQMHLDKNITEASFQAILISYNKHGETLYMAWATNDMKPSSYIDEKKIFDEWFYNRFPNKNSATELRDSLFETAMSMWNVMVNDAIGVGLIGLGFTNYEG